MNHARTDIVDLRNVRTKEQERIARLRWEAGEEARRAEAYRQAHTPRPQRHWNDIVSGVFRVASLLLVVGTATVYVPSIASSLSYFTDTEASGSTLASGLFDLTATTTQHAETLSCGGMEDAIITLSSDADGLESHITASTTALSGSLELCNSIELDVRHHSNTVFSGQLYDFAATDLTDGDLRFIASVSEHAGPFDDDVSCTMTIRFESWLSCSSDFAQSGYSDAEEVELTFTIDSDTCHECDDPCDTCGDLYVDIENNNHATVTNNIIVISNTGDNEGTGSTTIETGGASSTVFIYNEINTSSTTVISTCTCTDCGCPTPCDIDPCVVPNAQSTEHASSSEERMIEEVATEAASSSDEVVSEEQGQETTDDSPPPEDESEDSNEATDAEDLALQIQAQLDERLSGLLK